MDASLKPILRSISLALRHELEGWRDEQNAWQPGDLERRLNELGVWSDRSSKPLDEMRHLSAEDRGARVVVDGYLQLRSEAGVGRASAFSEFVRESAYNWANRLLALRCMEARGIIDEVILQKAAYSGRSLVHQRFLRKNPEAATGEDDGLFAVLFAEFTDRSAELPALFDPHSAAVALRPSAAALKHCVALLSGTEVVRGQDPASDEVFTASDAFGWAYQYWNTEEKSRVFEAVRTKKGTKIEGSDIIPATQLYTEPYMVKFLIQNSLGALWMSLNPQSRLCENWEYYVTDADRAPVNALAASRSVREFTILDPALGSGHFHLEAFDLLFAMYQEEDPELSPREIAASILNNNLFGIDLDERAIQIAEAALWMKAKDVAPDLEASDLNSFHEHLVATNIRLPRGRNHLEAFLKDHPEDAPLRPALERVFQGLEHANELGSLLQIEEPVDHELRRLKQEADRANVTPPIQDEMFEPVVVQSSLPLGLVGYDEWKAAALGRLKSHFEQEAEAADSTRAFFGASACKGLSLFDLLERRYNVVAANPPYMGSKNMSTIIRTYVELHYESGKRDLYSAFICRAHNLVAESGMIAMVTLASWLTKDSFTKLRAAFLQSTAIGSVALLGRYAFSEADPPGYPVLFVIQKVPPEPSHIVRAISIGKPSNADEQAVILRNALRSAAEVGPRRQFVKIEQARFIDLPNNVILVGLTPQLIALMVDEPHLDSALVLCEPSTTGDNTHYVRYAWEVTKSKRWAEMSKGGGHRRWRGLEIYRLDWEHGGARIKAEPGSYIRNENHMFSAGITFTAMSRHGISFRLMPPGMTFGKAGPGILPRVSNADGFLALLNSRPYQLLLRNINPGASISLGNVARLPLVSPTEHLCVLEKLTLNGAETDCECDLRESLFNPDSLSVNGTSLKQATALILVASVKAAAVSSILHHAINKATENLLELSSHSSDAISAFFGPHPATFPLLNGYATGLIVDELCGKSPELGNLIASAGKCSHSELELATFKTRLQQCYQQGPGGSSQVDEVEDSTEDESEEEDPLTLSAQSSIRPETFLEEISLKLGVHPISIFLMLKEGVEREGWRCLPEEKRLTEDRFCVLVLRMIGHLWPKQIATGDRLPGWVDSDGIIPLSSGSSEPMLVARIIDRLAVEFPGGNPSTIRTEFEEIVGASLDHWLTNGFFAGHIAQFKKRPIAWQIQSQPRSLSGRRRSASVCEPVFSCLLYYHRLDADLLPKLRSQYLGVLKIAFETEHRTLESLRQPTAEQLARKAELDVLLEELNQFDTQLQAVVESGFGPAVLLPRLRQIAVDDAMLSLKSRWLARLAELLQSGGPPGASSALQEWQQAASDLDHHEEFADWIANAVDHLPHHCATACVKSMDVSEVPDDPTPATLAELICSKTEAMTEAALTCLCAEWRNQYEIHVIRPLKDLIATGTTQMDQLAAELDSMDRRDVVRVETITREQKRIKADVKLWKKEIKDKSEVVSALAARIRHWTSPEPSTWESWLASTALFDEISSLDGQRPAPTTIRDFVQQESLYAPDLNDGVRVNIAPLQLAGLLAAEVLAAKDLDKAIADRAEWRADERRWVREGKLPKPGWWQQQNEEVSA